MRAILEHGFGEDLGNVVLHTGPAAVAACGAIRARGFAIGRHAVVACDDPADPAAGPVIAHEVAHLLQKRRPGPRDEAGAEREARRAARIVMAGGMVVLRTASDPAAVSCWGEVGHYYTVYVTMLAAGLPGTDAASIAFYAQLPDEAAELDAFEAAAVRLTTATFLGGPIGGAVQYYKDCKPIQQGLHALTGLPVPEEYARRLKIMDALSPASPDFLFDFGLACHPYGDTYAHRKNGRMYSSPVGHALDKHEPDMVSEKTWSAYANYVTTLHGIAATKYSKASARLAADTLVKRLQPLVKLASQQAQAIKIREVASGFGPPLVDYDPLAADARPIFQVAWTYPGHFKNRPIADMLSRARRLAREWQP
ncbi:DUF4157 domain-containing protein [Roseomonas sp. BN140053]|uniref:eCIS core domain-containing protein n=1 Tax=Roseomonas sp. BN140053 TaxID=3391898 RepID=UPI0039E8200D